MKPIYMRTENITDEDRLFMEAIMTEFSHRKMLMEIHGISEKNPLDDKRREDG